MSIMLDRVSYIYHPGTPFARTALQELSLTIPEGEILGITGEVGAGKSTLLQLVNGLIRPVTGRVLVEGRNLAGMKKREMAAVRRRVGLVFQHPERQLFGYNVFDELAFGPRNAGLGRAETDERVEWALQAVGMPAAFKDRTISSLSAGERRRIAIAGVLALKPAYLLLDEPTAGLDGEGIRRLTDTLQDIGGKPGNTIVIVSHNLRQLLGISQRVVWLKEGRVWLDLRREDIIDNYETLQSSVMLPDTLKVMYGLNQRGWNLDPAALTPETLGAAIASKLKENDSTQMNTD
ncbi:MAG: ATP-binding cassette domain-containing protein [Deltaproteobacteria bacterium]